MTGTRSWRQRLTKPQQIQSILDTHEDCDVCGNYDLDYEEGRGELQDKILETWREIVNNLPPATSVHFWRIDNPPTEKTGPIFRATVEEGGGLSLLRNEIRNLRDKDLEIIGIRLSDGKLSLFFKLV